MKLEQEFETAVTAPREARALIREKAIDVVPASTLADVLTVVTELIDNAVRHGDGGSVRLSLDVAGHTVSGEVQSQGAAEIELPDPHSRDLQGLGLLIVNAIADRWRIEQRDGTVTAVGFEIGFV